MTKKYLVNAPDKQFLHLANAYGIVSLKHGSIITDDAMVKMFPQYFELIPEFMYKKVKSDSTKYNKSTETVEETPKIKKDKKPIKVKAKKMKKAPKVKKEKISEKKE